MRSKIIICLSKEDLESPTVDEVQNLVPFNFLVKESPECNLTEWELYMCIYSNAAKVLDRNAMASPNYIKIGLFSQYISGCKRLCSDMIDTAFSNDLQDIFNVTFDDIYNVYYYCDEQIIREDSFIKNSSFGDEYYITKVYEYEVY